MFEELNVLVFCNLGFSFTANINVFLVRNDSYVGLPVVPCCYDGVVVENKRAFSYML